jgi:hypothetical protein
VLVTYWYTQLSFNIFLLGKKTKSWSTTRFLTERVLLASRIPAYSLSLKVFLKKNILVDFSSNWMGQSGPLLTGLFGVWRHSEAHHQHVRQQSRSTTWAMLGQANYGPLTERKLVYMSKCEKKTVLASSKFKLFYCKTSLSTRPLINGKKRWWCSYTKVERVEIVLCTQLASFCTLWSWCTFVVEVENFHWLATI